MFSSQKSSKEGPSSSRPSRDIWPWDTDERIKVEYNDGAGKSRANSSRRKVIRLDDRHEACSVGTNTSDIGHPREHSGILKKPYQTNGDLDLLLGVQDSRDDHLHQRRPHQSSRQQLRDRTPDGSYLDSAQTSVANLTDSRAIRETEIRFLNTHVPNPSQAYHTKKSGPKLTYVDIPFPGSHSHNVQSLPGSRHAGNMDHYPVDGAGGHVNSHEAGGSIRTRRKKRELNDIAQDSEILSKLKEKIRQQQLNSSSSDISLSRDDSLVDGLTSSEREPRHVIHTPYDAVSLRPGANCDGMDKTVITRKVATVPSTTSYKGFAEIGSDKNQQTSSHHATVVKKKVKKPSAVNIQPRKYELYDYHNPVEADVPSSTEKVKKPTRVVSHDRKNNHASNDIITTSSWRAGQELIRQKLGPSRSRKTSSESQSQRKEVIQPEQQRRPDGAEDYDISLPVGSDNAGTISKDRRKTKLELAEETKKLLDDDLERQIDDHNKHNTSDEDASKNVRSSRSRSAVKRKAPKQSEPDKQQAAVAAKQRHYDQEEVRKYIAKQKADRQRRRKEEEEKEMNEHEKRKRHLEELYTKQKTSSSKPKSRQRSRQSRRPDGIESNDRRRVICGESDKENQDTHNNTAPDLEDDSSTLTGSTEEETTPVGTPRDDKKTESKTEGAKRMLLDPKFNINVDEALSKFSEVVKQRKAQAGLFVDSSYQPPSVSTVDNDHDLEHRKQAIKDMADSLRSRLKGEALSKGTKPSESHVTFQESGSSTGSKDNKEYTTRYDRLVGKSDDVFKTNVNLPGIQDLGKRAREMLEDNYQKEAAIRIQSAYRGHSARRSLDLATPVGSSKPGETASKKQKTDEEETELSISSTFSEVTPTDTDNNSLQHHLSKRDRMLLNERRHSPVGGAGYTPPSRYKWEGPKADPYSVMNVLNRRSKQKEAYSLNPVDQQIRETVTQSVHPTSDHRPSSRSTQPYSSLLPAAVTAESNLRPQRNNKSMSEVSTDHSARSSLANSLTLGTRNGSEAIKSHQESAKFTSSRDEDQSETEDTYSNLVESESVHVRSRPNSTVPPKTDVSERSEHWNTSEKRTTPTGTPSLDNVHTLPPRYSPNSLDRQMMAELNRLESLEESYRQLAGVERTRAVSLAQQESVSLAQVIKSRQISHDLKMKELQLEAQQEAQASSQQLNDIRLRTHGKLSASKSYHQPVSFNMEPKLHSTPASKLNESTSKRDTSYSLSLTDVKRREASRARTDAEDFSDSVSVPRSKQASKMSLTASSYSSRHSKPSRSASGSKTETKSVSTARESQDTDSSSIKSVSEADAADDSKVESIAEDLPDGDYTLSFDDSITEDESFRQVLPSESHRKEVKRRHIDDSLIHDEAGTSQLSIGDVSSLFVGGDTFSRFTADMVRQLMKEEEVRAQHQAAMLRIRETALKKNADAELAWLQQQKQHLRDKGADDIYPSIKKKERIVLKELREKQAEIHRLQEANMQASRERQAVLKHQEAIAKLHQKKRMSKLQDGLKKLTGRLGRPADMHTEDEASAFEEGSDINEDISAKDYKSDSEVYTDRSTPGKTSKGDKKKLQKQQKLWLNDKYLTQREHKLLNRKRNAEELLAWKKKLDADEAKVYELEKKAMDAWESTKVKTETENKTSKKTTPKPEKSASQRVSKNDDAKHKESESVISEQISVSETYTATSHRPDDAPTKDKTQADVKRRPKESSSEMSIPEEVPSATNLSSVTPDKNKVNESSDDTVVNSSVNEEYTNETFDTETTASKQQKPLKRYLPQGSPLPSPWSRRTGSESESEDSISHTDTVSDTSDYEGRIRHLSDELRRRRKEFEILKKERKQRKKEKLKAQEESLKKQVEAYDNYINQLKHEQSDLELEPPRSVVKPLIKHPSKTKGGHVNKDVNGSRRSPRDQQEGSFSSSYEDTLNGSDSAQTSPSLSDSRDSNKLSPLDMKKPSFLDRISEGSESAGSEKLARQKDAKETVSQSSVSEMVEELSQASSEVSSEKTESGLLKIDTTRPAEADGKEEDHGKSGADEDLSYSMDFTASATDLKPALSARSDRSLPNLLSEKDNSKISEHIDEALSVHSEDSKSLKLDLVRKEEAADEVDAMPGKPGSGSAVTGIQESDSENDSHTKSHHTLSYSPTVSRPSSGTERSVASSYGVNFEDEESERTVESESESEKTPVKVAAPTKSASHISEEDISEHISVSLPSLTEKKPSSQRDDDANQILDQLLGEITDEESTPRGPTPLIGEDDTNSLLLTDPLAEFQIGEEVLVWGRKKGKLLYKGKVGAKPGIWAGVELEVAAESPDELCEKYFQCRQNHGVLVPGSDISAMTEDIKSASIKPTADDSITDPDDVSTTTESDLEQVLKETAAKVEQFETREPSDTEKNLLVDKLTDEITAEMLTDSVETMGRISDKQPPGKKVPPPTLPKPKLSLDKAGEPQGKAAESPQSSPEKTTDSVMHNLLENAVTQMIDIRNKKRNKNNNLNNEVPLTNGHVGSESDQSDIGLETKAFRDDLHRPHSPVLGAPKSQDIQQLDNDMFDLLGEGDDDDYFEETLGVSKSPEKTANLQSTPKVEKVVYAVPHEKPEVERIINDAIDIYWNCRRCGEPLNNVAAPESFLNTDDDHLSMEKKSEQTYRRMLFDLTGEIICDIYSPEEEVEPKAWEKPKHKRPQYTKTYVPPTTVDALRPVVQDAVSDLLGLNGIRKSDRVKNRFTMNKRKDHVDNILAEELRKEEPEWTDYDDAELDVKHTLADSIFEMLLIETVDTCTKIHNKRYNAS